MKKLIAVLLTVLTLMIPVAANEAAAESDAEGNVIIFMYHDFRVGELSEEDDQCYVTTDIKFREDIDTLLDMGYKSLNLERYYTGDYDRAENYFIITIDDGYISNYEIVLPILLEYGIYADIFICTEDTGRANHFSYGDAKKMEATGFVKIYSHLTKHIDSLTLTIDQFYKLSEKSYRYLYKRISEDRLLMTAYPHGSYSRETAEKLYENGTVFQMVQDKIETDDPDWNPADYGILYRVNVEYTADIEELVGYYIMQFCDI